VLGGSSSDQRHGVHARPSRRLRRCAQKGGARLVLCGRAAYYKTPANPGRQARNELAKAGGDGAIASNGQTRRSALRRLDRAARPPVFPIPRGYNPGCRKVSVRSQYSIRTAGVPPPARLPQARPLATTTRRRRHRARARSFTSLDGIILTDARRSRAWRRTSTARLRRPRAGLR